MQRQLPTLWPVGAMPAGTRVRITEDELWIGPWAQAVEGRVSAMAAPEPVVSRNSKPGELNYWIDFDPPQLDSDGDGPYRKAQIRGRYLEAL